MPLLYEKREHIGVLTFSRPEARNAWCEEFGKGLEEKLPQLEEDREIRCVVLTGDDNGRAFSAGADLKNPRTHTERSIAAFIEGVPTRRRSSPISLLADFAKPLIAAVNGYAIGIGCIVTFCCDLIVASERAEWRLPQVALGIMPAQAGAVRAARWIGKGHAMKLAMGFPLPADEAYRIGLAQWLVPHTELMPQALKVADHIAGLSPLAARIAKESLMSGLNVPLNEAAHADLYRFMALELTEDKNEGHRAWRERRTPDFKGR
jgi:enoyl-CoA hydratase/carnithine racemase